MMSRSLGEYKGRRHYNSASRVFLIYLLNRVLLFIKILSPWISCFLRLIIYLKLKNMGRYLAIIIVNLKSVLGLMWRTQAMSGRKLRLFRRNLSRFWYIIIHQIEMTSGYQLLLIELHPFIAWHYRIRMLILSHQLRSACLWYRVIPKCH